MKMYKDNPKFNEIVKRMQEEHGYEFIINAVGSYVFQFRKFDEFGNTYSIAVEDHLDDQDPDYYIYAECIAGDKIWAYFITYKEMCLVKELIDIFKEENL